MLTGSLSFLGSAPYDNHLQTILSNQVSEADTRKAKDSSPPIGYIALLEEFQSETWLKVADLQTEDTNGVHDLT